MVGPSRIFAESAVVNPLPFEPFVFGIITLALFGVVGFVMWSYRDVANRHRGTTVTNVDAHAHDRLDEHTHVQ